MAIGDRIHLPFTEATMDSGHYLNNGYAKLSFSADLVAANSYTANINNSVVGPVPFNTDNATTVSDVSAAIRGLSFISSSRVIDAHSIEVLASTSADLSVDTIVGTFIRDEVVTINGAQTAKFVSLQNNVMKVRSLSASLGAAADNYTIVGATSGATALINGSSATLNAASSVRYTDAEAIPLFIYGSLVTLGASQAGTSLFNKADQSIAIPMIYVKIIP
jgi:hypothetical protein